MTYPGLCKVISGGQTGADTGGLLAAHRAGLLTGGTAPAGFMTSRGPNYLLLVLGLKAEGSLQTRTKKNIQDSDATVILSGDMKSAGTRLTVKYCSESAKKCLAIDIDELQTLYGDIGAVPAEQIDRMGKLICQFVSQHQVRILNVAGNRERFDDGRTTKITDAVLTRAFMHLDLEGLLMRA